PPALAFRVVVEAIDGRGGRVRSFPLDRAPERLGFVDNFAIPELATDARRVEYEVLPEVESVLAKVVGQERRACGDDSALPADARRDRGDPLHLGARIFRSDVVGLS